MTFGPATTAWFERAFAAPTPAQSGAWDAIASGEHALVVAPTGSGKTLAAFLWAIDEMLAEPVPDTAQRTRILYVSPLKALAFDVERNLSRPLAGIRAEAARTGAELPDLRVGVRTGDTPPAERRRLVTRPPDILITTPESLFLMLTSAAREALTHVRTVVVDEVHAIAGTKRGAHLFLSLERLDALTPVPVQRVGLSATVRPAEEVARALAGERSLDDGGRPVRVVAPPSPRRLELDVQLPVPDLAAPGPPPGSAPDATAPEDAAAPDDTAAPDDAAGPGRRPEPPSIWPHVAARVVDLVESHRSTIVFVGSRRLAERLAAQVNEEHDRRRGGAGVEGEGEVWPATVPGQSGTSLGLTPVLARAHHGSMSPSERRIAEEALKSGELRCVVATSTLELGIDMGEVDLVVQIGAPPTVASTVQRVGRAGHQVGGTSRGVLLPVHRAELLPTLVAARSALAGEVEQTSLPRTPLDVLAQQLLAMVAVEDLSPAEALTRVRRAASYADLGEATFDAVVDMLSGRYPAEEFAELRPRLVHDRAAGLLRARPGAARLAVTSGGTIPDRGLFGVYLSGGEGTGARRVGELDEEMVFESRVGDTFTLGNSTWRIETITADRVLVTPAPGRPGRLPFWLGDTLGRPATFGAEIGRTVREWPAPADGTGNAGTSGADRPGPATSTADAEGLTLAPETAAGIGAWIADQREATSAVPDDETIVVERFRDELGDWRIVVHCLAGRRVNAPWALLIAAALRERTGADAQAQAADDGIVLRLPPGATEELGPGDLLVDPGDVRSRVVDALTGSPLLAARFREAASRALLLPRRFPGRRQPLWQQRHRAAALFTVASRYPEFPMTLEAVREALQDDYDVPALTELMAAIAARRVRVVEVTTPRPSPWARSLLMGYTARFLYGEDVPPGERRAAALALDTSLLAELLGGDTADLVDVLDPRAVAEVAAEVGLLTEAARARDAEGAVDLVRRLGPLPRSELAERLEEPADVEAVAEALVGAERVLEVAVGGEPHLVVAEDAGRMRGALGVDLPDGVPDELLADVADPLGDLLRRYARTHGPFTPADVAARYGLPVGTLRAPLDRLVAEEVLVTGRVTGHAEMLELVDADVLRRIRRRSLALLRGEVDAVDPTVLARATLRWHGVAAEGAGPNPRDANGAEVEAALLDTIDRLAGRPLPLVGLETHVLPRRVPGYRPGTLDELVAGGEVVWVARGPHTHPATPDQVVLLPADAVADLAPAGDSWSAPTGEPGPGQHLPTERLLRSVVRALSDGGSRTLSDLVAAVAAPDAGDPWDLGEPAREIVPPDTSAGTAPPGAVAPETAPPDAPPPDAAVVGEALWWLATSGIVTSDTFAAVRSRAAQVGGPLRARTASRPPRPMRGGLRRRATAAVRPRSTLAAAPSDLAGRWSLVRRSVVEPDPTVALAARVAQLVETHGVLTRDSSGVDELPGGFSATYEVLRRLEDAGQVRRGYVVDGLGGAQFALEAMLATLREVGRDGSGPGATTDAPVLHVLAASDPANPYGAALPWPTTEGLRPSRRPGAFVVLVDAVPALFVERGGRSLLTLTTDPGALPAAATALAAQARDGRLPRATLRQVDGAPPAGTHGAGPAERALVAAGWVRGPGGLHPPS
ncbi:DEAD/DEAH box helicase [Georgenia sp. Z1491]|uniref:DEAD/DEAH box helicase n=1 Tax=Georgenia sp. Z1491 TaxID=3416707 RepID=UPI003CEBE63B